MTDSFSLNGAKAALIELGKIIDSYLKHETIASDESKLLENAVNNAAYHNGWFTRENIFMSLRGIAFMLNEAQMDKWIDNYRALQQPLPKNVAAIMAGNIPAVGFHDMICVLVSGHHFLGKTSSADKFLLPALAEILAHIYSPFKNRIRFTDKVLTDFDAVIATGSNNANTYFNYYFSGKPHVFRGHRNAVAVIKGTEDSHSLALLGSDVFSYYGMGCRNVSHILLPQNYKPETLIDAFIDRNQVMENHKYRNNYQYYQTIYLMNNQTFFDGGYMLLKEDSSIPSPVSVVHYSFYKGESDIAVFLEQHKNQIQCVMTERGGAHHSFAFGRSQFPGPGDYADNIDTMHFLYKL